MKVHGYGMTGPGTSRSNNQDAILINDDAGVYIVCDGMGGHAGGALASATALKVICQYLENYLTKIAEGFQSEGYGPLVKLIEGAVQRACAVIHQMGMETPGCAGMGTTVTMLLVHQDKAIMGHVGDSRLYLCRQGLVHQLSRDHTLVQDLFEEGAMTFEQTKTSSYAHVLTRSVGHHPSVQVDTLVFDLLPGDTCFLCTDGFSDKVEVEQELMQLLNNCELDQIPDKLYSLADRLDGSDNISVLLVQGEEEAERQAADIERSADVLLILEALKEMFLFSDLTLEELLRVMKIVCLVDCPPGAVLIREGDATGNMYIILDGQVVIERAGKEITRLRARTHFGEMALLHQGPRTATVRVVEHSRFVMLDQAGFIKLVNGETSVGVKLLWKLAGELTTRLERANTQLYGA